MIHDQSVPKKQYSVTFLSKVEHFRSRKCVWKCRLENGGHFVWASMCFNKDLESGQLEVDTRLFLHAAHTGEQCYRSVVIVSDDIDVFLISLASIPHKGYVVLLACNDKIASQVTVKSWAQAWVKYASAYSIVLAPGRGTCEALLVFNCLIICPDAAIAMIICKYTRKCSQVNCSCVANGLTCSRLCRLKFYGNQPVDGDDTQAEDEEELVDMGDCFQQNLLKGRTVSQEWLSVHLFEWTFRLTVLYCTVLYCTVQ